jgi:cyclopropane-fatty-acyl-phospholipid synthase
VAGVKARPGIGIGEVEDPSDRELRPAHAQLFEILDVTRETRDYELSMLEWAKRLDAAKDDVVARWGEETYRAFRLFLRGGAHAFRTNALQAYHLVAERRAAPGPRPSTASRVVQFLAGLR